MRRTTLALATLAAMGWGLAAQADLFSNIYRGLDIAATPSGSPVFSTGDGTRVNGARSGRLRIVPNGVVGKGYRLEFDRTFGQDSRGRAEVFRFGCGAELTLQGATQATAGYTHCGDKLYCGTLDATVNNLQYYLRTKNGVQDVELSGTLNVANNVEINTLGFYNTILDVSNTNSQLVVDGIVVRDEDDTNFDIGPIVIEGNIFVDALSGLLSGLGADTSGLDSLFPKSPMDQINDAIDDQLQSLDVVAGTTAENSMPSLLLQTIFGGNDDAVTELVDGMLDGTVTGGQAAMAAERRYVPEPGTLLLITLGATLVRCRRR